MKPTKFCNCITCTDCQYYIECAEYEIETEKSKGKFSFGKLKAVKSITIDNNLKD